MMHPAPRGALLAAGAVAGFTTGYLARRAATPASLGRDR